MVSPSSVNPARIRTAKLSENTLIPGAALPRTAKVKCYDEIHRHERRGHLDANEENFAGLVTKVPPHFR